jgi:uncharacterized Zn finger protein (UPF0148 family)
MVCPDCGSDMVREDGGWLCLVCGKEVEAGYAGNGSQEGAIDGQRRVY